MQNHQILYCFFMSKVLLWWKTGTAFWYWSANIFLILGILRAQLKGKQPRYILINIYELFEIKIDFCYFFFLTAMTF